MEENVKRELKAELREKVFNEFRRLISEDTTIKNKLAKNRKFAEVIEKITLDNLTFTAPTFIKGYVYGNATAVGEQGSYKRTICRDFDSIEMVVWDDDFELQHIYGTALEASKHFAELQPFFDISCYYDHRKGAVAEAVGKEVCEKDLKGLNFEMKEYRLNNFKFVETKSKFSVPVYSVDVEINDGKNRRRHHLGWYDEEADKFYYKMKVPMSGGKKLLLTLLLVGGAAAAILAYLYFNK